MTGTEIEPVAPEEAVAPPPVPVPEAVPAAPPAPPAPESTDTAAGPLMGAALEEAVKDGSGETVAKDAAEILTNAPSFDVQGILTAALEKKAKDIAGKKATQAIDAVLSIGEAGLAKEALKLRKKALQSRGSLAALTKNWNALPYDKQEAILLGMGGPGGRKAWQELCHASGLIGMGVKVSPKLMKGTLRTVMPTEMQRSTNLWSAADMQKFVSMGVLDCPEELALRVDQAEGNALKTFATGLSWFAKTLPPGLSFLVSLAARKEGKGAQQALNMTNVRKMVKGEMPTPVEAAETPDEGVASTRAETQKTANVPPKKDLKVRIDSEKKPPEGMIGKTAKEPTLGEKVAAAGPGAVKTAEKMFNLVKDNQIQSPEQPADPPFGSDGGINPGPPEEPTIGSDGGINPGPPETPPGAIH